MQSSLLSFLTDTRRLVEERIEGFLREHKPRHVYVAFSGGKDSAACLAATRSVTDNIIAVFIHIAGQTHGDNVRAAYMVAERLGLRIYRVVARYRGAIRQFFTEHSVEKPSMLHVIVRSYRTNLDYWAAMLRHGFPAPIERYGTGIRWCCSEFKEKWMLELPPTGVDAGTPVTHWITGVKATDSRFRRERYSLVNTIQRGRLRMITLAPLIDLSDGDVWGLLRAYGIHDAVKQQYDRWMQAPNCTLCPMMPKKVMEHTVERLPTPFLAKVMEILDRLDRRPKNRFQQDKINMWKQVISQELEKRHQER